MFTTALSFAVANRGILLKLGAAVAVAFVIYMLVIQPRNELRSAQKQIVETAKARDAALAANQAR